MLPIVITESVMMWTARVLPQHRLPATFLFLLSVFVQFATCFMGEAGGGFLILRYEIRKRPSSEQEAAASGECKAGGIVGQS